MTINNSNTEIQYDFVFVNPDFAALRKALLELQKHASVLVLFEEDLNRKDRFITTRTFPLHLSELSRLHSVRRKWDKVIAAVPHLFHAQKVIYQGQEKRGYIKSLAADSYYRNRYQKKSFRLKNTKKEEFLFLNPLQRKGIVFQEFRFNISRFFIELLKYFEATGGKIVINGFKRQNSKQLFLNESKTIIRSENIFEINSKYAAGLVLPVAPFENFEMITKEKDSILRFFESEKQVQAEQIEQSRKLVSVEELVKAGIKYFNINSNDIAEVKIPLTDAVYSIHDTLSLLLNFLPCSFEGNSIENNYELCLEKYDLAKQTGIPFDQFKPLFHRYGKGIDEITESAYELLNQSRDWIKLWELAEQRYQKKYEWLK